MKTYSMKLKILNERSANPFLKGQKWAFVWPSPTPPFYFTFSSFFHLIFLCLSKLSQFLFSSSLPFPPPPFLPPTVPDSNIKQEGENGQAIMIYDQCMQQLLTFKMTVVGGGRNGGWVSVWVCVYQSPGCVCGEDEGWIDKRLGSLVCRFQQIALWWAGAINQKAEHRFH